MGCFSRGTMLGEHVGTGVNDLRQPTPLSQAVIFFVLSSTYHEAHDSILYFNDSEFERSTSLEKYCFPGR